MTRARLFWLIALVLAVIVSGIGVVYAKNQSRALFVQLQKVRAQHAQADLEWGRWQLELATDGSLQDVMRIARKRLHMRVPNANDLVVVD